MQSGWFTWGNLSLRNHQKINEFSNSKGFERNILPGPGICNFLRCIKWVPPLVGNLNERSQKTTDLASLRAELILSDYFRAGQTEDFLQEVRGGNVRGAELNHFFLPQQQSEQQRQFVGKHSQILSVCLRLLRWNGFHRERGLTGTAGLDFLLDGAGGGHLIVLALLPHTKTKARNTTNSQQHFWYPTIKPAKKQQKANKNRPTVGGGGV